MADKSRVWRYEESGCWGYFIACFAVGEIPRNVYGEVCSLPYEAWAEYFLPTFDHIFHLYIVLFGMPHSCAVDEKILVGNIYCRAAFGYNAVSAVPYYVLYARRRDACRYIIVFYFGFAERIDSGFVFIEPSLVVWLPDAEVFAARREDSCRGEQYSKELSLGCPTVGVCHCFICVCIAVINIMLL